MKSLQSGDIVIRVRHLSANQQAILRSSLETWEIEHEVIPPTLEPGQDNPWCYNVAKMTDRIHELGGLRTVSLTEAQVYEELTSATLKILFLMLDGEFHTADTISHVAGQVEGVKRMRELRPLLYPFHLKIVYVRGSGYQIQRIPGGAMDLIGKIVGGDEFV